MEILQQLFNTIVSRKQADPKSSYVASLFAKGNKKIAQKVGEEATETVLAAAGGNPQEIVAESADLLFHMLVLWAAHGVTPDMVMDELKRREGTSGIDEKQSRKGVAMTAADDATLDLLFRNARTHNGWQDKPVPDSLLKEVYELFKWGPTSANCSPARIVFVKSKEAKERLKPSLDKGNLEKTLAAPVTAIIGHDLEFYEKLPKLFPHADARSWFAGKPEAILTTVGLRNGSLQGAYFIIAARALGLDCGPMSGFDNAKVDAEFFKGTKVKSNFLCNLGYGDPSKLYPRSPRLEFDEACKIA